MSASVFELLLGQVQALQAEQERVDGEVRARKAQVDKLKADIAREHREANQATERHAKLCMQVATARGDLWLASFDADQAKAAVARTESELAALEAATAEHVTSIDAAAGALLANVHALLKRVAPDLMNDETGARKEMNDKAACLRETLVENESCLRALTVREQALAEEVAALRLDLDSRESAAVALLEAEKEVGPDVAVVDPAAEEGHAEPAAAADPGYAPLVPFAPDDGTDDGGDSGVVSGAGSGQPGLAPSDVLDMVSLSLSSSSSSSSSPLEDAAGRLYQRRPTRPRVTDAIEEFSTNQGGGEEEVFSSLSLYSDDLRGVSGHHLSDARIDRASAESDAWQIEDNGTRGATGQGSRGGKARFTYY